MAKVPGRDGSLHYNTTGTTYVLVGQVLEIGDAGSEEDLIDASTYGQPWKDYVLGQKDGDEMTVRIAFDPTDTTHAGLLDDYTNSVSKKFQLRHTAWPTRALEINTIVRAYRERSPLDGVYEAEIGLKIVNPGVVEVTLP